MPPPTPQTARRLPDFFLAGQSKSGTTALYEMLRQHPAIFMPATKEPSYYCRDLLADGGPWQAPTREQYLELFSPARPAQRVGEASPTYVWAPRAAERIAADRPDAEVIVVLRDPATFLVSLHAEMLRHRIEVEPDLRRALALEPARRRGERTVATNSRPSALHYSERVRYAEHLRRYLAVFDAAQLLVLVYEDVRADNAAALRRIFAFLGVDPAFTPHPSAANPSVRLRAPRTRRALTWATKGDDVVARTGRRLVKAVTPRAARRASVDAVAGHVVYGRPRPADPALLAELRARFAPEVAEVSALLGIDLAARWGDGGETAV